MRARPRSPGLSLIELIVSIGIIALLAGLVLSAVAKVRSAAARTDCANRLRNIGLALHNYHGTAGHLPAGLTVRGGKDPMPYVTWNARLLPHLEQAAVWDEMVRAYAADRNFLNVPPHTGRSRSVAAFACPAAPWAQRPGPKLGLGFTTYLGAGGTNQFTRDGTLFVDSDIRFADITDGLSSTVMVGERPPCTDELLGWWYAGWGQDQYGSAEVVLGSREVNTYYRYNVSCPFGPYHFSPGTAENPCDSFHFWSPHPGGANFLFADGSVRFLDYSADPILPALATRAGGESVAAPD